VQTAANETESGTKLSYQCWCCLFFSSWNLWTWN